MYNSQYYTCEQIDQRLLQGYLDDYNTQTGQNLTKEQFLAKLAEVFSPTFLSNYFTKAETTQLVYDETHVSSESILTDRVQSENYVQPSQTIGQPVIFGSHSNHNLYEIPANSRVKVNTISGGNYGFALTDLNDNVLEYCNNSESEHTFGLHSVATRLYTSAEKTDNVTLYRYTPVKELAALVPGIIEEIGSLEDSGYLFAGIIHTTGGGVPTPSHKVFYLAYSPGTYNNFLDENGEPIVLERGINILKYNGTAWSSNMYLHIDDFPAKNNINHLINSQSVHQHLVFNANVALYGPDDYQHTLTLQEAINAAADKHLNNLARIICFRSTDGVKIAIFASTAINSGFTNPNNWDVLSIKGTYDELSTIEAIISKYVYGSNVINEEISADEGFINKALLSNGTFNDNNDYITKKYIAEGNVGYYISGRSSGYLTGALCVAFDSNGNVLESYEVNKAADYQYFLIITPVNTSYIYICGTGSSQPKCFNTTLGTYAYSKFEIKNILSKLEGDILDSSYSNCVNIKSLTPISHGGSQNLAIHDKQIIGDSVRYFTFGEHAVYDIPANTGVKITMYSGGSYGFAITAATDDKVLNYFTNSEPEHLISPKPFATKLYVSLVKTNNVYTIESFDYNEDLVIKVEKEITQQYITGSNYVQPSQTIGQPIAFGSHSNHYKYNIPAGKAVKIKTLSGGNYGFALTTPNANNVIEYCNNSQSEYTFKAQNFNSVLFVSANKIDTVIEISFTDVKSLAAEVPGIQKDIKEIQEELDISEEIILQRDSYDEGYVMPNQVVGEQVVFGSHSNHSVYSIESGVDVVIKTLSGGSYGFALTDLNDNVLEYCDNSQSEYTFEARDVATRLYTSFEKTDSVKIIKHYPIKRLVEEIPGMQEELSSVNFWKGKNIWWCGTSIPAGSDATLGSEETIAGNYPTQVGRNLSCNKLWNKAVGGSMCRANVRTGDYDGANISNITSALSMTSAEVEAFITNYDTLKQLPHNTSWPSALSEGDKSRMRAGSFESRLLPFLTGAQTLENPTGAFPDLFVIDHGHNDFKYSKSDGTSDIGLLPTVENIQSGELAEDTYMTSNNYEKLAYFLGYADGNELIQRVPSGYLSSFVASLNRNCFIGAINFIMTVILSHNPKARFVFISNYEYEKGYYPNYAPVIDAQRYLANDWAFPLCEVYKYLAFSKRIIPKAKEYFASLFADTPSANWPSAAKTCRDNNKDCFLFQLYNPDNVHPHSDISGDANKVYAGVISEFIKQCR